MSQDSIDHEAATDAVSRGMAEWNRVKEASIDAIARCRDAEARATRAEARGEILGTQNKSLSEENVRLRSQVEDAKVGLSAAMAALLAAKDNLNTGDYRAIGSVKAPTEVERGGLNAIEKALDLKPEKPIPEFLQKGPAGA